MASARAQLGLVLAAIPAMAQSAPSVISSVRQWSLDTATRVAIQTSGEIRFRVEVLQNPDRLFIDVDNAECRVNGRRYSTIPVGDRYVKQIRVAQSQPSVVRVVLDLEGPVDYEISRLTAPHRLMVEVRAKPGTARPVSHRDSAAAAGVAGQTTNAKTDERVAPSFSAPLAPATSRIIVPVPTPPDIPDSTPRQPLPAKRNRDGSRSLTRTLGLKLARVVIDPGHGGHDHGTTGASGLREKDLVLDVGQRLGKLLETKLGTQVTYTRVDDTYVALEDRTAIANRDKADLFLSIHANSSSSRQAYGTETYFLRFTSSPEELEVAARENATTAKSVYELQDMVKKIALQEKVEESREFANRVQSSLYTVWARSGSPARNRGLKKAPFVVLIGASMPSVLTEIGFLSNPREEGQLNRPEYRQRIAEALLRGITQYVESLSHFAMARAAELN